MWGKSELKINYSFQGVLLKENKSFRYVHHISKYSGINLENSEISGKVYFSQFHKLKTVCASYFLTNSGKFWKILGVWFVCASRCLTTR